MRLFILAYAAYAVSWFLPVIDVGDAVIPLAFRFESLLKDLGVPSESGGDPEHGAGTWKGYDAAHAVWDQFWETVRERPAKARRILDAAWSNLANPLFVLAAFLTVFNRVRLATLVITAGTFSAARWLMDGDLEPTALRAGYWCWLGAFVVAAVGLWMASARAVLPAPGERARPR